MTQNIKETIERLRNEVELMQSDTALIGSFTLPSDITAMLDYVEMLENALDEIYSMATVESVAQTEVARKALGHDQKD